MNILVTGYKGFIGKNLIFFLKNNKNFKIFKYGKKNSLKDLKNYVQKSDIIFHLAGENRNNLNKEFLKNNVNITKNIIKFTKRKNNKTLIIYASTNQINKKNNIYTQTKILAENYLKKNSNKMVSVKIYRFTNIFGKWAKPNYNSVIATFCFNISRNRKIKLSQKNEDLKFLYIDDVIEMFKKDIYYKNYKKIRVISEFSKSYKIKLYNLAKKISFFHTNRRNITNNTELAHGFDKLLYSTYLSYIPTSNFKYNVTPITDSRGSFFEFIKSRKNGQISILNVKPNQLRGNHYHMTKVERFYILSGQGVFNYKNMITGQRKKIKVVSSKNTIVETIPGWAHSIKNTGKKDLVFVLWSNEIFNNKKPDTVYYELNSK